MSQTGSSGLYRTGVNGGYTPGSYERFDMPGGVAQQTRTVDEGAMIAACTETSKAFAWWSKDRANVANQCIHLVRKRMY